MTKKQHYVPRFYLERFGDDQGFVHTYDFKQNKTYKKKPEDLCHQNYLYEVEWSGSERAYKKYMLPNHLEKIFSRYENEFSKLLRKMDRVCHIDQSPKALICSPKEKEILFRLVINFYIRSPQVMVALAVNEIPEDIEQIEWIGALHEALDLMGIGGWDSIVKMAIKEAYLTEEWEGGPAFDLRSEIKKLNFTFYRAQDNCFITSDQPVSIGIDNHILKNNKQCLYFALSPKVAVLFGNYEETKHMKNRMIVLEDSFVDDFNILMLRKTKEFIGKGIANSKEHILKYLNQI